MILLVVNVNLVNNALEITTKMHGMSFTPYLTVITSTIVIITMGVLFLLGAACISVGLSLIVESSKKEL